MESVAEVAALRKARRVSFKMARAALASARKAPSESMRAELVKLALAARENCAHYLASLSYLEAVAS